MRDLGKEANNLKASVLFTYYTVKYFLNLLILLVLGMFLATNIIKFSLLSERCSPHYGADHSVQCMGLKSGEKV